MAIISAACTVNIAEQEIVTPENGEVTSLTASIDNEIPTRTGFVVDDENNIARFNWVDNEQIDVAVKLADNVYTGVHFIAPTGGSASVEFLDAQVPGETTVSSLRADYPQAAVWDWAFYPSRSDDDANNNGFGIEWDIRPNHYDEDLAAYPTENELITVTIPQVINPHMDNQLSVVPLLGKKGAGNVFTFTPMTGVLAITVNNLTSEIDYLTVSSASAWLSGSFHVNRPAGDPGYIGQNTVVAGKHSVTLHFSGIEGTGKFYIPIPSGSIPAGLTVTIGASSDPENTMTVTTKKDITITTGVISRAPALNFTAPDQLWADYCEGYFIDDFMWAQHSAFTAGTWIPIIIQRSGLHTDKYRIANPYTAAKTAFGYSNYYAGIEADDYLVFRISPEEVVTYGTFLTGVEDKDSSGKPMMITYSKVWSSSKTGAATKVESHYKNGNIYEVQLGAIYSDPNDSGYMYTRDGEGNASTQRIHIRFTDSTPEGWDDLCTVQYKDDFIFKERLKYAANTYIDLTIQESDKYDGHYRLPNPYPLLAAQLGYDIPDYVGVPDDYLYLNIDEDGFVYFPALHAGINLDSKDLTITHPSEVAGKSSAKNKIGTIQANGLPDYIQLAPIYHETGNVGYLYSRDGYDNLIKIVFPEYTETWTLLGEGLYYDEWMWNANSFPPSKVPVRLWRSDEDANRYRIDNPYTVAATAYKRDASGSADEYIYLQVDPSTGYVTFGSVITGMSKENVDVEKTKNFAIADAATWESVKTSGSSISASSSKVAAGTNAAPLEIQLYSAYYDSDDVSYFYTNNTGLKHLYFPGWNAGETWSDYSTGTYRDVTYDKEVNSTDAIGTVAVTIQQSNNDSKRFRIANPYRANVNAEYLRSTYDEYLYFNTASSGNLVYFEPFRPGVRMNSDPKELGMNHPVSSNLEGWAQGGSDFTGTSVLSYSGSRPKQIQLGAHYFDVATPNPGYCYTRQGSAWPDDRIYITFDNATKAVITPKQYPMVPAYDNPVEIITMPCGTLERLVIKITGIDLSKVTGLRLYQNGWMNSAYVAPDGDGVVTMTDFSNATISGDIDLNCWLTDITIGASIRFTVQEAVVDGESLPIVQDTGVSHHCGIVLNNGGDSINLRECGEETVSSFRIPALVTTTAGTLIAAYDVRYDSSTDLQNDIDVGFKRSTDGGRTWSSLGFAMDMGTYGYDDDILAGTKTWKQAQQLNGIGDPCLLVDENTGDIFCFGLWAHGHGGSRVLGYAGTGYDIDDTPQFMMVKSTDDGLTWSEPVNITRQAKRPEWGATLQGPGRGITMKDGTLVIPNQHQEGGSLNSGIMYSTDHGLTWHTHNYAHRVTSEAAVAEIEPGVLLLTMRDETNSHYRRACITRDLGRTWTEHASNGQLLEPTCEASLIHVDAADNSLGLDLTIFSNPHATGRSNFTIQISTDKGVTWPYNLTIDQGSSLGYTCLTMVDDSTVGIVYESSRGNILFQAIPLADIVR